MDWTTFADKLGEREISIFQTRDAAGNWEIHFGLYDGGRYMRGKTIYQPEEIPAALWRLVMEPAGKVK